MNTNQNMKALIPLFEGQVGGPFTCVEDGFTIIARLHKALIVQFEEVPERVNWFNEGELVCCQIQHDGTAFEVIRPASFRDRKLFRIPYWLESAVPNCCGQPMHFIRQFEDTEIMDERPADAKLWWTETVCFFVFACSKCLECKVIGQQF